MKAPDLEFESIYKLMYACVAIVLVVFIITIVSGRAQASNEDSICRQVLNADNSPNELASDKTRVYEFSYAGSNKRFLIFKDYIDGHWITSKVVEISK